MSGKLRVRRPSTGSMLGMLALFVALGGTALAATGQLVNIADGTNAANVAKVTSSGALNVTGSTTTPLPSKPLFRHTHLPEGNNLVLGPSNSTVVLERVGVSNYISQYANTGASVRLSLHGVDSTGACRSSGSPISQYDVKPSDTVIDPLGPHVLKAPAGSTGWCLYAYVTMQNSSSYYWPAIFLNGYVASGSLPPGAAARSSRSAAASSGTPPLHKE